MPATKKVKKVKRPSVEKTKRSVNVYGLDGSVTRQTELPESFTTPLRTDLIQRASVSIHANRRQPYAPTPTAGMRHSVSTWGKGHGVSRVQRLRQGSRAAQSPNNVGGRRAHPPRVERRLEKRMNRKEMSLARLSALSAVSEMSVVRARGHLLPDDVTVPVVIEDDLEKIEKTKEAVALLEKIGLAEDLGRAEEGKRIRAGRGKMRGRKYRTRKSLLVVVSGSCPAQKSFSNILGVDVAAVDSLNVEHLAPGGLPGRLTVMSESALEKIGGRWSS